MRLSRMVVAMLAFGFAHSSAPQKQTPENPSAKPNAAYEVVSINSLAILQKPALRGFFNTGRLPVPHLC
jgi:hypothetical protein